MSYRAKVLLSITLTVAAAVWLVAALISARVTQTFERRESERARAAVDLFRREFDRRGFDINARVSAIAASGAVSRMLTTAADTFSFVHEAEPLAREHGLELLTIAGRDGAIISSAHWPARFGYREDWLTRVANGNDSKIVLRMEELPDGPVLALMAVRTVRSMDALLYVAGGLRLEQRFLESLPAFQGMRVSLLPGKAAAEQTADVVTDIPLTARDGEVLATLRARQSRAELFQLRGHVRQTAFTVGGMAIAAGLLLGFWAASRVTRPVRRLASTVRTVAAGDWTARASVSSRDEIGQLARDFNQMTQELVNQRERMLQTERVAAWRELARRLAHELKNPLFPLQITVENLRHARAAGRTDFDEIFDESTSTLLAELNNLKTIIARFGDFARMPAPQFESVDINEIAREAMRLFEARTAGRPGVRTHLELAAGLPPVHADPDQLRRALQNLALNGLDAMPNGGDLSIRTGQSNGRVVIEVSDTGAGITSEEQARLFTPYYTTKQHGTGLGLAIVQSVVSDHRGTISVTSEPDRGTTFRMEMPHEQTAAG